MKNKYIIWIGISFLVIVVLALVAFVATRQGSTRRGIQDQTNPSQQGSTESQADGFARQYGSTCNKQASPVFTASPLALDKIGGIEPLGKTADGHVTPVDHVYVSPIDANVPDNTYDVVMPADGRLVDVQRMPSQYVGDKTDVKLAVDDFRLVVSFSCRYYSIFIHVHTLNPKIAQSVGTINPGQSKQLSLDLKAGELLAHLGGSSFDWTMVDTQTTLPGFITPSLYQQEPWKIHTIDPFSVYTGDLKTKLEAKSLRTTAPFGGKLDWDKPGALIGNWFKQGTNGYQGATPDRYWDGHLSIAPNNIDPTGVIYSTGNWQGKAAQFVIKGDFKPETITPANGTVKIELVSPNYKQADGSPFTGGVFKRGMVLDKTSGQVAGVVLLQVQAGEKLKVEQFPGKTAAQVTDFTAAASTYER
jgi:hypothetical protein